MKPSISIIVPVHNNADSIEACLGSILSQSLANIEVIAIDDNSDDASRSLLEAKAAQDQRLRVLSYSESMTASRARKDGVMLAQGEHIMFVDADDALEPGICERLDAEMRNDPSDIIQFGTTVNNEKNAPADQVSWLETFLIPYDGSLKNDEVFTGCFEEGLYTYSLWNKIYRADVCKRAFSHIDDGRFPRANDLYAFFILAFFSKSYRGLPDAVGYVYNFGAGEGGRRKLSRASFKNLCAMGLVADELKKFLESEGVFESHETAYEKVRNNLLWDCFSKFRDNLAEEDFGFGYDALLEYWKAPEIVSLMIQTYQGSEKTVAMKLTGSSSVAPKQKSVKTIGVYYHRIGCGGAERVTCDLIDVWKRAGFDVVLFTDLEPGESDYPLPDGVSRVVIPSFFSTTKENYRTRAEAFSQALESYNVDCLVYHAWESYLLLWDMLLAKAACLPTVVYCHSAFSSVLRGPHAHFASQPFVFRLADSIVALSESDRRYWSMFNDNVFKTINAASVDLQSSYGGSLDNPTLIWVGRLSPEKHPLDAVRILARVVKRVPAAKLIVVGGDDQGSHISQDLLDYISSHNLSEHVTLAGYQNDVAPYFHKATVQIITSEFEGYPLSLAEGKAFGLPCVMYSLPYIAFCENPRGIIDVPMGSVEDAADAVCDLLENPELYEAYSREAHVSAEELTCFDFAAQWLQIFSSLALPRSQKAIDGAELVMLSSLYDAYAAGVEKHHTLLGAARSEADAAHRETADTRAEYENSTSYKVGRRVTSIPRIVRDRLRRR